MNKRQFIFSGGHGRAWASWGLFDRWDRSLGCIVMIGTEDGPVYRVNAILEKDGPEVEVPGSPFDSLMDAKFMLAAAVAGRP